jgi:hypothetical protein
MRRVAWMILLFGCYDSYGIGDRICEGPCLDDGGVRGDAALFRDGSVRDGSVRDGSVRDGSVVRDGGRDTGLDAARRDAGTDPIFEPLPDDPPPDIGLEPGTGSYYLYELCWRTRSVVCRAANECCDDERRHLPVDSCIEDLGAECQRRYLPGGGSELIDVDREALSRAIEEWVEAAESCERPPDFKVTFEGTLRRGERCEYLAGDPWHNSSLCEPGLFCNFAGTCAEVADRGERCEPGVEPSCRENLRCNELDRLCSDRYPTGSECFSDFDCQTLWCAETGRCASSSPRNAWCARG